MIVCYDNLLRKEHTSEPTPVVTSNMTMKGGSFEENLLHEDPSLRFQATCTGTEQSIYFHMTAFSQIPQNFVIGFFDWKDPAVYDTILVETGFNLPPILWFPFLTIDLTSITTEDDRPGGPRNMLFQFDNPAAANLWKFRFQNSGSPRDMDISNIVIMKAFEVAQNPDTARVLELSQREQAVRRATDGSPHFARAQRAPIEGAQYGWSRAPRLGSQQIDTVDDKWGDQLIGIIPPNSSGETVPTGAPHFFGRSSSLTLVGHEGDGVLDHVHAMTWRLEGAR